MGVPNFVLSRLDRVGGAALGRIGTRRLINCGLRRTRQNDHVWNIIAIRQPDRC